MKLVYFYLPHHPVIFMLEYMAMIHINSFFRESDKQFNPFARLDKNTVFQSLFIRSRFSSITRNDFELGTMDMEWMNHSPHFIRLVIDLPNFRDSFLLLEVNPVRIEFLSVDGDLIHHSKQF